MVGRVNERIVQQAMEQHHLNSASSQPKDAQAAAQSNRDEPEAISGSATSMKQQNLAENQTPSESNNEGQLILDASCAPADIHYPTDLELRGQ